jgi:hypothetical protein
MGNNLSVNLLNFEKETLRTYFYVKSMISERALLCLNDPRPRPLVLLIRVVLGGRLVWTISRSSCRSKQQRHNDSVYK